jgi:hypothetical protein
MQQQLELCQRWRDRRASYRPAGEVFDHRRAAVAPIDDATAKAFVEKHHYSASYPAARFRAGLFIKDRLTRERLVGVGVYSVPMNQRVVPAYFAGLAPSEGSSWGASSCSTSWPRTLKAGPSPACIANSSWPCPRFGA